MGSGLLLAVRKEKKMIYAPLARNYHGKAVYIINFEEIVYHQGGALYLIKPQRKIMHAGA